SDFGFWADWEVQPKWNLCNTAGPDEERVDPSKVKAVKQFLESGDKVLVCTHATFRFAVDELGVEAFDNCLIAVDEFHHVSSNPNNRLGAQLTDFIKRDKAHLVAMTGSYFRGDAEPVLLPEDEAKFETVTYTYYEQLNGYEHLKSLDIGYFFYTGRYLSAIEEVLDPTKKTIVHIPNVNSRESTMQGKVEEVNHIMSTLGTWEGRDETTGFHMVRQASGNVLKIADLVDDSENSDRGKVLNALKDPAHKNDRDHVDIIIALGMAKEGFDWIWCEHALTVGYRSSLTEIIQIIGRATRDAVGKESATFTNLIAEPDASEADVVDAINNTLKAIAASLLMEQVLAPRFNFTPKDSGPIKDFEYEGGYQEGRTNVGFNEERGEFHFEIKGLVEPKSEEANRICREDLNELITQVVQDKQSLEKGLFDEEMVPQEITQVRMGQIVRARYPDLTEEDQESVRQHAIAALNLTQRAKQLAQEGATADGEDKANTALIKGVKKFALEVTELDIDLVDSINPFAAAYAVLSKSMDQNVLKQVQRVITAKKTKLSPDEALELAKRASRFKRERSRVPSASSSDPWEVKLAEGAAAFMRYRDEGRYE
ncbi:MAG: DEAD/DEAH box helicase, partial [Pontixanthobacter sp.]